MHVVPSSKSYRKNRDRRLAAVFVSISLIASGAIVLPTVAADPVFAAPTTAFTVLQELFDLPGTRTVRLGENITADPGEHLVMPTDSTVKTLDLNGFTLTISSPLKNTAAIDVQPGASFVVQDTSANSDGQLTATGGYFGAGIGGGALGASGAVTVMSGVVTATGGEYASGIGGGWHGNGGDVTISGGTVTATGVSGGSGIGGGVGRDSEGGRPGGKVTITGGVVTATGSSSPKFDNYGGAGIGGGGCIFGGAGGNGGLVTITGGVVTAKGGADAAGIGGGCFGSGAHVEISGGETSATGGSAGAGIGGGGDAGGGSLHISGGELDATGGRLAAGIGGGANGAGSTVTISGGRITATALADGSTFRSGGAAIGSGGVVSGLARPGGTLVFQGFAPNPVPSLPLTYAPQAGNPANASTITSDESTPHVWNFTEVVSAKQPRDDTRVVIEWGEVSAAPTGLALVAGDEQVELAWVGPTDTGGSAVTGYSVQYREKDTSMWIMVAPSVPTTPYTVRGLTNGVEYDFRVSAMNAIGTGAPSTVETATPKAAPTPTPTPTPTPGKATITLSSSSISEGGILTVSLAGAPAGMGAQLWVHSTPVMVWSGAVGNDGTLAETITLPGIVSAGAHRVELRLENGTSVWADLTVSGSATTAAASGTLATTGSGFPWATAALATLLILTALVLLVMSRRRAKNH
ncbi:fibronectin type III domain-containing protein [Salinibacterium sp. PAMC 21357]|uniref:fibronectin type III domain-containing protein n=1 Tax=Salinibacterium sp. PAMC 21357 TaxID=1112215 RepID=UPI000289F509|nr:fibronectin type III domain-containing protein [Salinibacterium sp. PAMC 21357]